MGFEFTGDSLSDFVGRSKDAVDPAIRQMVEDGGDAVVRWVVQNTPVETHHLRDSINKIRLRRVRTESGEGWESGAETDVDYAPHVEDGTGLWGPKHAKYRIEPKKPGGVLAFFARMKTPEGKPVLSPDNNPVEGQLVFARYVMHPGSPGQHMFATGVAMAEARFDQITQAGLDQWVRRSEGR